MIPSFSYVIEKYYLFILLISLIISPGLAELTLITIFIYIFIKYREELLKVLKEEKIILFFFLMIALTSVINNYEFSVKGLIYFRFFLYFLALSVMFNLKRDLKISNLIIYLWLFVILDLILQYYTGQDIFGYKSFAYKSIEIDREVLRLTGPFDDSRSGFYLVILTIILSIFLIKEHKYYLLTFTNLVNLVIIPLTGERTSLIYCCVLLLASLIFHIKKNKKILLIIIFLMAILVSFLIKQSPQIIKDRNINLLQYQINNFSKTQWYAHYVTSFEIFKDYKTFGIGVRNFRNVCKFDKYDGLFDKSFRCSTHPHNKYFEILSETGIITFIIFIIILYQIFKRNAYSNLDIYHKIFLIILTLILFDPILPSKSFFNNWMSCIFWLILSSLNIKKDNRN